MIVKEMTTTFASVLERLGLADPIVEWEHPAELAHGDYATNVAMRYAKELGTNPRELADKIVEAVSADLPADIEKLEIAGPGFINVWLAAGFYIKSLDEIVEKGEGFGKSDFLAGTRWLVEHTSPNPNKAMHLGHLRNNLTGMAIARLLECGEADVTRDMIDNNRGIAIARLMWGYLKFAHKENTDMTDVAYWFGHQDEWNTPEDAGVRPDRFVDDLYIRGSQDTKENPDSEQAVRQFVIDWENKDEKVWALWQKVLDYSYAGQKLTLDRLGNQWDHKWHEHEHYQMGKDLVMEGLEKGVFQKLDDGAILTNLESYGIPDTVAIKSDGTSLYITQDLALTKLKREKFNPDKMIWVIGPEQGMALKQVFATCEQLGIGKVEDYIHISYGLILMKEKATGAFKKMSSRDGDAIFIDDLIDMVKEEVTTKMAEKGAENDALAEMMAVGAIKFSFLLGGRNHDIAFDPERSADTEGDSGPYLQYTYARCQSLLKKRRPAPHGAGLKGGGEFETMEIDRILYRFPEVVELAAKEYAPHHVANYLLEVARMFNSWYGNTQIIVGDDPAGTAARLARVAGVAQIIKNGLWVLGIEAPESM